MSPSGSYITASLLKAPSYPTTRSTRTGSRVRAAEEGRTEEARQLEAQAKQRALQEYIAAGFSPESFETGRPSIRARLAAEKIAERRPCRQPPRLHGRLRTRWPLREHCPAFAGLVSLCTPVVSSVDVGCLPHLSTVGLAGNNTCLRRSSVHPRARILRSSDDGRWRIHLRFITLCYPAWLRHAGRQSGYA